VCRWESKRVVPTSTELVGESGSVHGVNGELLAEGNPRGLWVFVRAPGFEGVVLTLVDGELGVLARLLLP